MTSTDEATVTKVVPPRSRSATAAAISSLLLGGVIDLFAQRASATNESLARASDARAPAVREAVAAKTPRPMKG